MTHHNILDPVCCSGGNMEVKYWRNFEVRRNNGKSIQVSKESSETTQLLH
jgi:hypothetical protein